MSTPTATVNLEAFLGALFPDDAGFVELRALPSGARGFFKRSDSQGIQQFLLGHSEQNIFFGVAGRLSRGDGSLTNCGLLVAVYVDIDFKAITESEARARLEKFPLRPSIIICSGGGLHVYFLLREPVDLQTETARVKSLLRRLAAHLGGDTASAEPARILRLPSSLNHKYAPPRHVLIERFEPERTYNLNDLDDLLLPEPACNTNSHGQNEIQDWLKLLQGAPETERHVTALKIAGHYLGIGRHPEEVEALLLGFAAQCTPPYTKREEIADIKHIVKDLATKDAAKSMGNASESGDGGPTPQGLSRALIEYPELLTLEIPERRRHTPWLPEASSALAYGPRGVGKTMWGLGLGTALVTGEPFLRWPITAPVGCLYVDGEMQIDELRARATALLPTPPRVPLLFLTSELAYHRLNRDLVLTSQATREEVTALLNQHPEIRVVIFDNISTLFAGIDEDRKRDWESIAAWLIRLRHRGLATVLIHHSGKGGQQRGTSGREDSLDTVIQLDRPVGYDPRQGCHFELRFTKSRSVKGEDVAPLDVTLTEQDGQLRWAYKTLEESRFDQVRRLLEEGITSPTEIGEELSITKGYASKLVRKARAEQGQR